MTDRERLEPWDLRNFAAPAVAQGVPIPKNADEAMTMNLVSHNWLQSYAPERLKAPATPVAGQSDVWRPIETANKCGGRVWLFDPALVDTDSNPTGTVDGHWQDDVGWQGDACWVGAVWSPHQDVWNTEQINPTHWMEKTSPATTTALKDTE